MADPNAEQVAELFKSALDHDEEEWTSFLESACPHDFSLRAEVRSLLSHHRAKSPLLEKPAIHLAAESFVGDETNRAGEMVGDYEILSLIGSGGMGDVYLAQDRTLPRKVALKVIGQGFAGPTLMRQLHREERILAALSHPYIARLYGSSVTADGAPFFIMEYVEGERLDEYCKRNCPTISERLELFRKVCTAVAYAHQHLVIHRDLKPANIRVTAEGEPKLLDFGIAKLLDAEATQNIELTMTFAAVMTPDYSSPEQVRGETMTTASDVYSLGVVLYQLLTGERPYRTTSRTPHEITRAISDQAPRRPSAVMAERDSEADNRDSSDSRFTIDSRALRGDLDTIILKALRKEPERRYLSVTQFSEDIRRHLVGLPVLARKDTWSYRAGKFVRRNKIAVAAAGLVALILVGAMGAISWQARVATRQAAVAAQQRDVAQREKLKAERINEFLQRMLSFSNQSITSVSPAAQKKNVTVNEMLDQIAPEVGKELADQPEVGAAVLRTIGTAYESQGQYAAAEKNLRQALQTQEQFHGENNAEVAETTMELATVCTRQQKVLEGCALMEKAVAFYRRQRETDAAHFRPIKLAEALDGLGVNRNIQGQTELAVSLLSEALQLASRAQLFRHERSFRAAIKTDLGGVLVLAGEIEKGEPLLRDSLVEFRAVSSQPRWEVGATLTMLGVAATAGRRGTEAQAFLVEGEQVYRQTLGENNPYVAWNLNQQAAALFQIGDLKNAEVKARASLAMWQGLFPENRLVGTDAMRSLGDILIKAGRTQEGEGYLRQIPRAP